MKCPECRSMSYVIETRDAGGTIRRRRECHICKHRFSTWEITQTERDAIEELADIKLALATLKRLI